MDIEINDKTSIGQIQHRFNEIYRYLWIDFCYHTVFGLLHSVPEKINPEVLVKSLCTLKGSKFINIDGKKTVCDLEKDFRETLALHVKVLRRSGNVWVGTSYTGKWPLENQNLEGEQISFELD